MPNNATTYFFELLQMAVGRRAVLSATPVKEEWKAMFRMAREQALEGMFTEAVCRLPDEMRPPRKPLTRLCSEVIMIEDANRRLFGKCCDLTAALAADGFASCILKGQGMALLYPKPLLRHSGDIDVWMKPSATDSSQATEDTIYNYARAIGPISDAVYHHVGVSVSIEHDDDKLLLKASDLETDEVEMHFRPSFMFCPRHNRRMQEWFDSQAPLMMDHTIEVDATLLAPDRNSSATTFHCPTPAFNVIFALAHIYRHIFDEGIGLRQLFDYYYVVMAFNAEADSATRSRTLGDLKYLGLFPFAQAVMHVLRAVFSLSDDEMLVAPNAETGRFLLDEIMRAGNFGQHDERITIAADETPLRKFIRRQIYSLRLLRYFPNEVLWQSYFKFWHRHWRLRHGWIKSWRED